MALLKSNSRGELTILNLNHLHYFFVCAQHKSVTRAAETLRISQPSLSQQLKVFENEIGERLFVRSGRSLELSASGKLLFEKSKDLFDIADSITASATSEELKEKTSVFRIGVSDQIERPFVVEILGHLLRSRHAQKNRFAIVSKNQREITEDFAKNRVELVITNTSLPRFKPFHQFEFPVFLATSRSQTRFKHLDERNLSAIFNCLEQDLVIPSRELVLRRETGKYLRKTHSVPETVFESNIVACLVQAIREEIGCGFLPLPYIYNDFEKGALSMIGPKNGYWQHRIYFYSSQNADLALVNNLVQIVGKYLGK